MKFFRIPILVILAVLVSGCGGSGEQQAQQDETPDEPRTIEIIGVNTLKFAVRSSADDIATVDDLTQNPGLLRLVSITASPGEEIRIVLATRSQMPASAMAHNWVLLAPGTDAEAFAEAAVQEAENNYIPQDMTDSILAHTDLAGGGEVVEITFTAPVEPGTYDFICTFPAHFAAGMHGTLIIEE